MYTNLEAVYAKYSDDFLFFHKMHAPIKRIQNKFRYQVLMRITGGRPLKEIYAAAEAHYKNTLVYVEENPSNLS